MMKIADVMTRDVMTAKNTDKLADVALIMKEMNIGALPVVDNNNNLVGIITDRDITVRAVAKGADPNNAQVGDFMTPSPITVSPENNVDDAADMMAEAQIRRLPVVQDGGIIGMVSLGDLAVDVDEPDMVSDTLLHVSEPVRSQLAA